VRVSAGGPPSGVVTFLFTDVEGSTRRWEADAQAMRAALVVHHKVLRTAIDGRGGFLFKHTGDGVCAAFASPTSAVHAAVGAQRALELPVRMGLATGEAELRDGDYFGTVLNRAARVMAAGHGGQILLAESTASLLSGVDLIDLGPRRLRDLPIPVGVFQVRAPGLQTEFPPLRALDVAPGNLRPQTTSFVGRESEVAELQAVIKAHRLMTLTGVGGVGKTRLATEVAARLADEFPDGIWFFDLAAVADPAAVPDAVAAVLGIIQQPGKSVSESVAAALEGRVRLLVFDNCEHVVDSVADLVEAILAASATVAILATSREGVGVSEERLWRVPSLDVNAGTESAVVNLFVDRAHSVVSDFSLAPPGEADAVVEICRRLDGIPLAIELAASRMAAMTASDVRDRLDQRLRLLVGSRRGLARHQTLRHAVAWSYDLLDDAEKVLLDRCSVFAGGFDLESACAVAGFDDPTTMPFSICSMPWCASRCWSPTDQRGGPGRVRRCFLITRWAGVRRGTASTGGSSTRSCPARFSCRTLSIAPLGRHASVDDMPALGCERTPVRSCAGCRGGDNLGGPAERTDPPCPLRIRCSLPRRRSDVRAHHQRATWCWWGRDGVYRFTALAGWRPVRRGVSGQLSRHRRLRAVCIRRRQRCERSRPVHGCELFQYQAGPRWRFPWRDGDRSDHHRSSTGCGIYPRVATGGRG
jgi:class 3 adenylate cyclase